MNKNQNNIVAKTEKMPIDIVFQKRLHMDHMLSHWKRKLQSAQRKVQKYQQNKKLYSNQLASLAK